MSKAKLRSGEIRPTRAELLAAAGSSIRDVIAPRLRVLFCGINPGLYSGAVGHHFARPGNRFWPALFAAGFTNRFLSPFEERELLQFGCGITNVVNRATASAHELKHEEILRGGRNLRSKVRRFRPRILAVLGVGVYRIAFNQPKAVLGPQSERIGATRIWVLPNPSGLNAHYQLAGLAALFQELRCAAEAVK
jgi:double-stranded uracil-DNA glycosylase